MERIKKDGAEDAEAEMRYTYIFGTSHALGKRLEVCPQVISSPTRMS